MVDSFAAETDWDFAFTVFQINLLPYARDILNYLRMPSVEDSKVYQKNNVITSETFGTTTYMGQISLLHIDGNHSLNSIRDDPDSWTSLILPGVLLIIDDYT